MQSQIQDDIFKKVIEGLNQVIGGSYSGSIKPETRLISELGVDSLKVAELSIILEEVFKQTLFLPAILSSVPDPYNLTVESVVQFVQAKIEEMS